MWRSMRRISHIDTTLENYSRLPVTSKIKKKDVSLIFVSATAYYVLMQVHRLGKNKNKKNHTQNFKYFTDLLLCLAMHFLFLKSTAFPDEDCYKAIHYS